MAPSNRRPAGASSSTRRAAGARPRAAAETRREPGTGRRPTGRAQQRGRRAGATDGGGGARSARPTSGVGPFGRRSTVRLAILGSVFVVLAIMLVPTVRAYLNQRGEMAVLSEKVTAQQQEVASLQAQTQHWQDPAFVEAQARERLKFVKPGEKSFTVIGAEKLLGDTTAGRSTVVTPQRGDQSVPWYGKVWSSLAMTDRLDGNAVTAPLTPVGDDARAATSSPSTDPATDGEQEPGTTIGSADGSGVTQP